MILYSLVFALLVLLTSTTDPSAAQSDGTSPGPESNRATTDPSANLIANGTEEGNQTSANGTTSVPGTELVPIVREIAPGCGPGRVNLTACMDLDPSMACYFGSGCLTNRVTKHKNLLHTSRTRLRNIMSSAQREKALGCDVGFIMRSIGLNYTIEYHTTADNLRLPYVFDAVGEQRTITIENGALMCRPDCAISNQTRTVTENVYYWTGTKSYVRDKSRANLRNCFSKPGTSFCWIGSGCLTGEYGKHDQLVWLSPERRASLNEDQIRELNSKCNVIAFLASTTGGFVISYHTTSDNAHLTFEIQKMIEKKEIDITISIVDGKLHCSEQCKFKPSRTAKNYWYGEIHVALLDEEPAESKEEMKKDDSGLGTIFLICAGALVAFIVAAIVIVKIAQNRHAARNKRRRDAIIAAARKPRSSGSHSREGLRKKEAEEDVQLLEKTPPLAETSTEELVSESAQKPSEKSVKGTKQA